MTAIRRRTFTIQKNAFPYSYTRRAEPTSRKVDIRETNAGGLAVAVSIEGSLEDEGDGVEIYEEVGGGGEPDR
jgi:hypothetical protein